jgi:mono/diheme cytochrome c family protein
MRAFAVAAVVAGVLAPLAAGAQTTANPDAGKKLALEVCARCHFVDPSQALIPRAEAPTFDDIAADPAVTDMSLRVFFRTPHKLMPDLHLTQQETDDVISYILSLRGAAEKRQ